MRNVVIAFALLGIATPAAATIWGVEARTAAGVGGAVPAQHDLDQTVFEDSLLVGAFSSSYVEVGPWVGAARAHALLDRGSLGVYAGGNHVTFDSENGPIEGYGSGSGTAAFHDRLAFQIEGASRFQQTPILVEFYVDGSNHGSSVHWSYNLTLDAGVRSTIVAQFDTDGFNSSWQDAAFRFGPVSYGIFNNEIDHFSGIAVYNLTGPAANIDISSSLNLSASRGGFSDYSGTAAMRFILPDNVTMTSASGRFLSDPYLGAVSVPEPATWALLILGFGGVGSTLRGRPRAPLAE